MDAIQFVTVEEAAQALRVHPATIRRLVWRRRIPHVRVGRVVRIPRAALEELGRRAVEAVRPRAG